MIFQIWISIKLPQQSQECRVKYVFFITQSGHVEILSGCSLSIWSQLYVSCVDVVGLCFIMFLCLSHSGRPQKQLCGGLGSSPHQNAFRSAAKRRTKERRQRAQMPPHRSDERKFPFNPTESCFHVLRSLSAAPLRGIDGWSSTQSQCTYGLHDLRSCSMAV